LVKKTALAEYIGTKKAKGLGAITLKDNDGLAAVSLVKDEQVILITRNGRCIRFNTNEISTTSRLTAGVKGIGLDDDDEVIAALPIRDTNDCLSVFSSSGFAKKIALTEITPQKRGGKGLTIYKTGMLTAAQLINDTDMVLIIGNKSSICVSGSEIPTMSKNATGNIVLKDKIISVSKV